MRNDYRLTFLKLFFIFNVVSAVPITGQLNTAYLETELADTIKLLKKGEFKEGIIFLTGDTLQTQIFHFKGKKKINNYLFCLAKNKNGKLDSFLPSEIMGYSVEDEQFIAHKSNDELFFIHKLDSGRVDLYDRMALLSDNRYLYYLKFQNRDSYLQICPDENNIMEYKLPDTRNYGSSGGTISYYQTKGIPEKFKAFVSVYMSDCERLEHMVQANFYTIQDIPTIVKVYNSCTEE